MDEDKGVSDDLVKYFMEHTNERFDKIEAKIDALLKFKWQIIGASGVFAGVVTLLFNLLTKA